MKKIPAVKARENNIKGVLIMLCKNCSYILTGKENFCPNCGNALERQGFSSVLPKEKKESINEKAKKPAEAPMSLDNMIFPPEKPYEKMPSSGVKRVNIDSDDFPSDEEEDNKGKSKKDNSAGKIFALILVCCTLAVTAFGLADYFGIAPGIAGVLSTFSFKRNVSDGNVSKAFSHSDTVVAPDVEYEPETAYVFSGDGLTMRKGPSNSFAPIHSLTDLTQVSILGASLSCEGWVYVYCGEKDSYGWLDGGFLCSDVIVESSVSEKNAPTQDIPASYYSEGYVI